MLRYHLGQLADWFRCMPANPLPFIGYVLQAMAMVPLITGGHWGSAIALFVGSALVTLTSVPSTLDTYQKAKRILRQRPDLPPAFVAAHSRFWCRRQALKLVGYEQRTR